MGRTTKLSHLGTAEPRNPNLIPMNPKLGNDDGAHAPEVAAGAPGSAPLFRPRSRMDDDELCSAEYRGHMIDCTADWKRRGIWHCFVRTKSGELVAEYRHEGDDRRAMLEGAARAAELLPNERTEP